MNGMVYLIIRESKSIPTFKTKFLSFIKDNEKKNICTYLSYTLSSGGIPIMMHYRFWLSPSPQLFFKVKRLI